MKSFDAFRLDTVNHCLWRGNDRLSLAPKAFDVLRYLVEHADRLVTQEEILEALWPETYVNPEVIKKYVLGIRKVLGDQSAKPSFVATFPRRGYQFVAPIREETGAPSLGTPPKGKKTVVGRESALNQLGGALHKALRGQRQVVFITGEAGIGKTTLVDAFLQGEVIGSETKIARGQCVEGFGGKEVYYPLLEAFGQLLQNSGGGPVVETFYKRAPTWLVQFPYLVSARQREALEKEIVGATRERMVREICEALEAITTQDPLVLCLEDLHWVDPSTLDVVSALARRRGLAKILVVATYRPADVIISQSPLRALKQDLVIHDLSTEISLERLECSDVAEYLAIEFANADFPAEFADVIFQHSGGNALFMVAILQDMAKKELISQVGGRWQLAVPLESIALSVPETLDQLIEVHFQQLSPVEQRILRSASVAGERFSAWVLATATEMDPEAIEEVCEGLAEKLQFIKPAGIQELPDGQISAHYEFLHSFYREVLYRRLSEVTRSKLHLLLAQRLKAVCDPCEQELATELALHFESGHDYVQAVRYLILAAENAAGRFAYRDAMEILQHALELVTCLSQPLRPDLEVRILELMGDAHFALGSLPESAQAYETAASRAGEAGLKTEQVHALLCAMYPLGFINPDQGLAGLEQAVHMSKDIQPLLLARAQMLAATGRLVFDTWRQEDADLCVSAQKTLRSLGDSATDADQQVTYAHFLTLRGNYREALEILEASVFRTDSAIKLIPHFGSLSGKTIALLRLGRLGEVLRLTRAGEELAEENRARSWLLGFREAWLRILAFDYPGALRICEEICKACAEYHSGQPHTIALVAAGYNNVERGEYREAIDNFTQVVHPKVTAKFFLHWVWRMTAQLELSNAWLLWGNVSKARAEAESFLESALSTDDPHLQALAWELKARVAIAEDDLTGARKFIEHALEIVEAHEIPVAAWQVHASAWQLFLRRQEHDAAEWHRERARECIFQIADSFESDEPLRKTFLSARPVALVLGAPTKNQEISFASAGR